MDVTNKTDVTDTHSHKDDVQPNVSIHTAEAHTNGQPAKTDYRTNVVYNRLWRSTNPDRALQDASMDSLYKLVMSSVQTNRCHSY